MKLVTLLALGLSIVVAVAAAGQLAAQTTNLGTTTTPLGTDTTTSTTPTAPRTTTLTPSASPTTSTATPVVLNVVEITRTVPSGATAVTAFTVPAGQTLIVTDLVVTNPGETPTCGASITRAGSAAPAVSAPTSTTTPAATGGTTSTGTTAGTTPTTPTMTTSTIATPGTSTPALAGTITQTDSTITGPLCVAARTTTSLPLTTGIEFGGGQTVQLMNVPDATTTTGATVTAPSPIAFHLRGVLVAS